MTALPKMFAAAALAVAAPFAATAAPAQTAAKAAPVKVAETPLGGHLLGSPAARTKIVEYASYTCPHCAMFEEEASAPLKNGYIQRGLASFELRNLIRDPVDLTAAMLARCGTASQFFDNHHLIMRNQPVWLSAVQSSSVETRKSWFEGSYAERLGKIAKDSGLYKLMQTRGFTPAQLDACLADETSQKTVAAMTEAGQAAGVTGTPMFMINGKLLKDVYSWAALKPLLPVR